MLWEAGGTGTGTYMSWCFPSSIVHSTTLAAGARVHTYRPRAPPPFHPHGASKHGHISGSEKVVSSFAVWTLYRKKQMNYEGRR